LVEDFPRVWNDPTVEQRERKRIVRLLIEDVTLIKADVITAHVRLRGGAMRTLTVPIGLPAWMLRKTPAAIVSTIDELLDTHSEVEVTAILNQRGHRTYRQIPYTLDRVVWLRDTYKLRSRRQRLQEQGFGTTEELRRRLGVSQSTIRRWRKDGLLSRRYHGNQGRCLYGPPENIDMLRANLRQSMNAQITGPTQIPQ
jgi:hypothetical protein